MKLKNLIAFTILIICSFGFASVFGAASVGEFPKITTSQLGQIYDQLDKLKKDKPAEFEKLKDGLNPRLEALKAELDTQMDPFSDDPCPDRQKIKKSLNDVLRFLSENTYGSDFKSLTDYLIQFHTDSQKGSCDENDALAMGMLVKEIEDFSNLQEAILRIKTQIDTIANKPQPLLKIRSPQL